jgi:hypothetical protein
MFLMGFRKDDCLLAVEVFEFGCDLVDVFTDFIAEFFEKF